MSSLELKAGEQERLRAFRFLTERPDESDLISAKKLINPEGLNKFLHEYSGRIGGEDKKVLSSLLLKRYAFLAVISLYTFSVFNKKLNVSPENVFLVDGEKNGLWMPGFYLQEQAAEPFTDRESAREELTREVFRDHLYPLIETVKKVGRISNLITWENVAIYLFWVYEVLIEQNELDHVRERLEEDFHWLLSESNAALFGSYHQNPLARYHSKKQYVAEQDSVMRVRKTCCFSYKLRGGESLRCSTCPQTCNVKKPKGVR
ncbi:siderophore-iron reductase FhuF [Rossellomorea vietnamensis]|uniref:Siderophore-iron reductase FhuF n=1 Tax=Rossellomorea vietnamensis TaxID=218284 RepID=A0A5D4MBQ4_9BACI|nr:siderophore-iron reductase FhuF [Rossellomorea vietnamensis]TYR99162.1 siderophore-iron reductase FhuF [Rossellomorea vietnamensis]